MARMAEFKTTAAYRPTGDQPTAVATLAEGLEAGDRYQTLLGATGTVGQKFIRLLADHPWFEVAAVAASSASAAWCSSAR